MPLCSLSQVFLFLLSRFVCSSWSGYALFCKVRSAVCWRSTYYSICEKDHRKSVSAPCTVCVGLVATNRGSFTYSIVSETFQNDPCGYIKINIFWLWLDYLSPAASLKWYPDKNSPITVLFQVTKYVYSNFHPYWTKNIQKSRLHSSPPPPRRRRGRRVRLAGRAPPAVHQHRVRQPAALAASGTTTQRGTSKSTFFPPPSCKAVFF